MTKDLVKKALLFTSAMFFPVWIAGCRTSSANSDAKADLTDNLARPRLRLPALQTPYKAVNNLLQVYDGCSQKWIETDIPYREEPTFPETALSKEPHSGGFVYKSAGKSFRLYDVDGLNVEKYIKPGSGETPKSFRGIWWMDGNPTPEVVVSFSNGIYDKAKGEFSFHYNEANAYLFPSSAAGIAMWTAGIAIDNTLFVRVQPDVDLNNVHYGQEAFVDPSIRYVGDVKLKAMIAIHVADGLWRRTTLEPLNCYNLRRIVDENGKKLPVFDYYAKRLPWINRFFGSSDPQVLIAPIEVKE